VPPPAALLQEALRPAAGGPLQPAGALGLPGAPPLLAGLLVLVLALPGGRGSGDPDLLLAGLSGLLAAGEGLPLPGGGLGLQLLTRLLALPLHCVWGDQ
jgi:hypothetical protein